MNHSHLVKYYGIGVAKNQKTSDDELFIVMEKMASSLNKIVFDTQAKVSYENQLIWAKQIISALKYLHSSGVEHHDLKLANVLVGRKYLLIATRLMRNIKFACRIMEYSKLWI